LPKTSTGALPRDSAGDFRSPTLTPEIWTPSHENPATPLAVLHVTRTYEHVRLLLL